MKSKVMLYLCLPVLVCWLSCSNSCDPESYVKYIDDPENNLVNEQIVGPLKYTVKSETANYTIIKQLGVKNLTKDKYEILKKSKGNYIQFNIKIQSSKDNNIPLFKTISKDVNLYAELNRYFGNDNGDFKIELDNKPIPLSTYYFISNQGFANYEEILVGTNLITEKTLAGADKLKLIYDDKIFGHGPLYFTFYTNDIISIPTLNF